MSSYSDIRNAAIRQCFVPALGIDHRLQYVATVRNIRFVDDARACNPNATWYALEEMPGTTILIMDAHPGWQQDYEQLKISINRKCALVCVCDSNAPHTPLPSSASVLFCSAPSLTQAVRIAYHYAHEGDNVLYSPACDSVDKTYQHRGREFTNAVRNL